MTFKKASELIRGFPIPLVAHLAANGWFAITLAQTMDKETARAMSKQLKEANSIPQDSMITYGNTYVRKVRCDRLIWRREGRHVFRCCLTSRR